MTPLPDGCRLQVAFLTGRSNPASCTLSPEQREFLHRLAAPGRHLVTINFPYDAAAQPFVATPLLRASIRNLRDYWSARRLEFTARHAPSVAALLRQAPHTVLLAGSCGLELLGGLRLDHDLLARVSVFAYGAVARTRPQCRTLLVQGRRDWLSRLFSPTPDRRVRAGHMSYLRTPAVVEICRAYVAEVERSLIA